MGLNNINFKLLSLNARGIRSFDKRKTVFNWLCKSGADILFLQETYSSKEVENIWRKQWKGDMFFSHGSSHSRGVLILVREQLDFKLLSSKVDDQGRYILVHAMIQDTPFLLINIYAPNKCAEQSEFFKSISNEINTCVTLDCSIVLGGDFNVIFDPELDGSGGIKKKKESVKNLEDICLEQDLVDIWRIRNPRERRFTWRQKSPVIQRRLDFWLVSDTLQEDVESVDIIPSTKSDHSAITLALDGIDDSKREPSFWKFNSTLVNDNEYCQLLDGNFKMWQEEFKEVIDKRVLWDLLKYKIRLFTIDYSKIKARSRRANLTEVEGKLHRCKEKCDAEPSIQNLEELERIQADYDELYDYITQGAIIRSRATWNNRFICFDKMSIYRDDMKKLGFLKIGDVVRANNSSRFNVYGTSMLSPEQNFFLMSLIDSFPPEWRAFAKSFTDSSLIEEIPNDPKIGLGNGNSVPILDVSAKQIYEIFLRKKQIPPTAKRKLTDKYPNINVEWDKVYSLPFRSTLESKTREFQYKILNCIVYTNEKLHRFGLVASPNCTFCQETAESIEHLLFSCKISSEFWKHVLSWLKDNEIYIETLKEWDLIFGKFDIKDNFTLINHLLLLGKYYIYSRKCQSGLPTVQGFIARIKLIYRIELQIARGKNKLSQHFTKWRKLVEVLT